MKAASALAVITALVMTATSASAWFAFNRLEVQALNDGSFEVISRPGTGPTDMWCAAGDYAQRVLGSAAAQRVYLVAGTGPAVTRPGYKAARFSLTPPAGVNTEVTSLSVSITRVGENLRSASARQYCYDSHRDEIYIN